MATLCIYWSLQTVFKKETLVSSLQNIANRQYLVKNCNFFTRVFAQKPTHKQSKASFIPKITINYGINIKK